MDKEEYADLVISELMRYIHLNERKYSKITAESQAVYSMWKLMNAERFPERARSLQENVPLPREIPLSPKLILKFSAHTHHRNPMIPSPDDRILYSRASDVPCRHFIIDRYCCHEISDETEK